MAENEEVSVDLDLTARKMSELCLSNLTSKAKESVDDFFEDRNNKSVKDKEETEVIKAADGESQGVSAASATAILAESAASENSSQDSKLEDQPTTSTLKFITWNIDGLDKKKLKVRNEAVCKRIEEEQADIVFLQEVIPETAAYISEKLSNYHCCFGREDFYFVGTLLKKASITFIDSEIIEFFFSNMLRNILRVNAIYKGIPLCLLNSHLESTLKGSGERKLQLKIAFRCMLKTSEEKTVIFGGDMNLRDKELTELGGVPSGIEDVWVTCGSRKECAYTFDMLLNDNLSTDWKFKPRCRYDRVYIRHSSPSKLKPVFFGLIGQERCTPHRCFPSDHWGILCHFEME